MDENKQTETPDEREKLLSQLDPEGRKLIEQILANNPLLTAAEAIEHVEDLHGKLPRQGESSES